MSAWKFKEYRVPAGACPHGENPFSAWYDAQNPTVRSTLEATIIILASTDDWNDPELKSFKELTEKPADVGLSEVRFKVIDGQKKRQFRVVGIWRQELHDFVFLMGLEKNGRSPNPPNAFEIARDLRLLMKEGKGLIYEHI